MKGFVRGEKLFYVLIVVVLTYLHTLVKYHRTVLTKIVNFIICKVFKVNSFS